MTPSKLILILCCCSLVLATQVRGATERLEYTSQELELDGELVKLRIPRGYVLELLTDDLDGPRLLQFDANNNLVVGSKSSQVYRLSPPYKKARVLLELNDYPHSVAFRHDQMYVATTGGLYRVRYSADLNKTPELKPTLIAKIPGGGGHNSRTVATGPDNRVYVSLGITGNCSDEYLDQSYPFDQRRGGIMVLDEKAAVPALKPYGSGLRNPVGFDWHPVSGEMYASNNGPDHLGFELPPEYFSRVVEGSFHGMPWFQYNGKKIVRDECADSKPPRPITDVPVPAAIFPARNAPMGVVFVPKGALSKVLEYDAIVALRGSWGTRPGGGFFGDNATRRHPKLVAVRFKNGKAQRVDDLVTGFQLENGDRVARPVGVAIGADGALYFTSDSGVNGLFRLRKQN